MPIKKKTSPHILNSASNFWVSVFIVLTSIKLLKLQAVILKDESTTGAMVLFMASCILSFLSLKNMSKSGALCETIVNIFFLAGLACLFVTNMLITFNVIN